MAAKRPLIIVGPALLCLVLGAALRPSPSPAQPPKQDRPPRPQKTTQLPAAIPTEQTRSELPVPAPPPTAATPIPCPKDVPTDGDLAAPWLLGLADPEFKALIGTRELDRIVGRVMERLMARRTDYDRPGDLEQFVERLNARIRTLQD